MNKEQREKKYYQIYNEIKKKILCGEYKHGEKLPSKRVMSDRSGYSVTTVESAYAILADEGYISPRERSGYYVSLSAPLPQRSINEEIPYLCEQRPEQAPDFEYSVWLKTLRKVLSDDPDKIFSKPENKGCAALRNAIADYLKRSRDMFAEPERIIIGSGAEQLYEIVVKILGREKIYGIEAPSYDKIKAVYIGAEAKICEMELGEDGIRSESLERERIDVLHVTPFHSYPSGITASLSKRYEYLKWAENAHGYIVEDDFYSEFFTSGRPPSTLYSLDAHDSVVYINTFSKSLSSSMRIGYMILPRSLMDEYERKLGRFSCSVPTLEQYALAEFISSGAFERHLNRARRKIKRNEF